MRIILQRRGNQDDEARIIIERESQDNGVPRQEEAGTSKDMKNNEDSFPKPPTAGGAVNVDDVNAIDTGPEQQEEEEVRGIMGIEAVFFFFL